MIFKFHDLQVSSATNLPEQRLKKSALAWGQKRKFRLAANKLL
jgi:hypothetical protein